MIIPPPYREERLLDDLHEYGICCMNSITPSWLWWPSLDCRTPVELFLQWNTRHGLAFYIRSPGSAAKAEILLWRDSSQGETLHGRRACLSEEPSMVKGKMATKVNDCSEGTNFIPGMSHGVYPLCACGSRELTECLYTIAVSHPYVQKTDHGIESKPDHHAHEQPLHLPNLLSLPLTTLLPAQS